LRDTTAGRVAELSPRLWGPNEFGLCRYLAAGLATLQTVDPRLSVDLALLADELDAEALHNSAGRELFTNPAKTIAARMTGRRVVLAGDCAATLVLARHGSSILLRIADRVAAATGLADAVMALSAGSSGGFRDARYSGEDLFHDEEIDGPLPERLRVLALTLGGERMVVAARVAGLDNVDLVAAEDVPDAADPAASLPAPTRAEQQLAILAVRLEMAAVYLRLVRG
jgi:hypothetical protein